MNVASCGDGANYRCDLDKTYKKLNKKMVKFHEPIFKCVKILNKLKIWEL